MPEVSLMRRRIEQLVRGYRMVFISGLPGVGKSLLVKQLVREAHRLGASVHTLQWDAIRTVFGTPEILARYPEVEGVTHIAIRRAVGRWAREGVRAWCEQFPGPGHILVGELPLVGNRLTELTEPCDDAAEPLLAGPNSSFVIPVPSFPVREAIEAARERSVARPRHQRELADAPPHVLRALWGDLYREACLLGFAAGGGTASVPYDPEIYAAVFEHRLRYRRAQRFPIDVVLPDCGSVYDFGVIVNELKARPDEVAHILASI